MRHPPHPARTHGKIPVVGVGATEGGFAALDAFLGGLPPESGAAFAVVAHPSLGPAGPLARRLGRCTATPVLAVTRTTRIEPNHVYLVPPETLLSAWGGGVDLLPPASSEPSAIPIDRFLRSLAEVMGRDAIGVVLSGRGSDGAEGIRRIREREGVGMAQRPEEAERGEMPRAAMRAGVVDRVVPAAELGPEIVRFLRRRDAIHLPVPGTEEEASDALDPVYAAIDELGGRDFSGTAPSVAFPKLRRRMQLAGTLALPDYLQRLREDRAELATLERDLTTSAGSFFQDPECLAVLEERVVASLLHRGRPDETLRIWVAGCASGEEAYSLAILLQERTEGMRDAPGIQIFATDRSERALGIAREGLYPEGIVDDVPEALLARHFAREPGGYRVRKSLRDRVLFTSHDLLRDPPFTRLDLVVCRGVLGDLKEEPRRRLLQLFHRCLRPGGYLLLNARAGIESIPGRFDTLDAHRRIFRSRSVPGDHHPSTLPARARTLDAESPQALAILHQRLVDLHAPASLVVNQDGEVVHLSERVGEYLHLPGGKPSTRLLDMVEGELKLELHLLLSSAFRSDDAVEGSVLMVEGRSIRPVVRSLPAHPGDSGGRWALVVLEDASPPESRSRARNGPDEVARLERELQRTRFWLQAQIDERAQTIEDYRAWNQELLAITKEQQALAEAVEASEEELQSVNQELHSVNAERQLQIDELARLNADLGNLINSTDIATIFLDRTLAIRRFTPKAAKLFYFMAADVGRPLGEIRHRLDYPELIEDASAVLEHLEGIDREVRTDDGSWFLVRLTPYQSPDDRVDGVVLTLTDTTAWKEAAIEREGLLQETRKANAAKAEFLGVLSHEFRTPLSGLVGYTDLLSEGLAGEVNEQQRAYLGRIKAAAKQLGGMVGEILTYARLESRQIPLELSVVDPGALARDVLDLVVPESAAKGLELKTAIDDGMPSLRTDEIKLRQILANLLGNAVKFTSEGHVELRVRADPSRIVFEVADTGAGIEIEDRERIFERFWQARSGRTRVHGGTGLGLTVVRELAILLGGGVAVESEPGAGSCFRVWLPLEGAGEDQRVSRRTRSEPVRVERRGSGRRENAR